METRVKICGLTRPKDVEAAIRHGADFLGFIVEAKSKRRLSVTEAAELAEPARGIIPRVAVTVDPDDGLLAKIMQEMAPDFIQCHGRETPDRLTGIAQTYGVKTIKAIAVESDADMKAAQRYFDACDFILYDAKPPYGQARGGHGLAFDWTILTHNPQPPTFALAGGLTPENVKLAVTRTKAPIVDVSSGVESRPGVKDAFKIGQFIKAAKYG